MRPLMMVCAAVMAVSSAEAQMDLTTLPPEPGEMVAKIDTCTTPLAECVTIAEEATGGKVAGVSYDFTNEFPVAIVDAYTDASRVELSINATNGAVLKTATFPRFPGWELSEEKMVTTDSGLMYFDLEEGEGEPAASPSMTVEVNYQGFLVDGTKFDSSFDRGESIKFPLNRVIKGWTEGVGSMKPGGKRKLIIPSNLGYGARGAGGTIPPNAVLVFDVELIGIEGAG